VPGLGGHRVDEPVDGLLVEGVELLGVGCAAAGADVLGDRVELFLVRPAR
jgi:hypothetical protein